MEMFDDDDTLVYEPDKTAAIILTGGDAEDEKAALEVILSQLSTTLHCLLTILGVSHGLISIHC